VDRAVERFLVRVRGRGEAAQLAHELQGGCSDLLVCRRRVEVEQRFDVAAHSGSRFSGSRVLEVIGFSGSQVLGSLTAILPTTRIHCTWPLASRTNSIDWPLSRPVVTTARSGP